MQQILNTLYVQTQGTYLRLDHDTLKLEVEKKTVFQMPLHHLGAIAAFGNILFSPFLLHRCADDGRDIVWLTQYGRFKARLTGETTGNVLLRRSQHATLDHSDKTLAIAQRVVAGKLQNARNVLKRAARESKMEGDRTVLNQAAEVHADSIKSVKTVESLEQLRGIEGYAAKAYFSVLTSMVRTNREVFTFERRSRRPPLNPINALLSFVYTLLTNECISACESVGLDPQIGFLHAIRPGRPALALDLMEELRPYLADRLVLTLINRGQLRGKDFTERPGGSVYLSEAGRKTVLAAYQKRKQETINHPIVETQVPLGLLVHTQARLMARHLRGDLSNYEPFILR